MVSRPRLEGLINEFGLHLILAGVGQFKGAIITLGLFPIETDTLFYLLGDDIFSVNIGQGAQAGFQPFFMGKGIEFCC